ncbi:amidohydrolase [Ferrimonas balearica DSM 9799]|uniref:Amidohydrolase n=1 Tax=Ferrimonas balearica (strain DSM 9799 / CCM 4581 / KCTC 23876 / PAT) TaxID=550540 RepID=E1SU40_FERBD|nr:amidohydrolase family protein [Ferrimonas balearica]ADN75187.1 amidohydrolase [Ferrimonas balearica DSM 9799]
MVVERHWVLGVLTGLSVISFSGYANQTQPELGIRDKTPSLTALTHARIVTEPGKVLDNATILIEDGIIRAVSRRVSIPDGAYQVDMTGYTLYPGFIDPYADYGLDWEYPGAPDDGPIYQIEPIGARHYNSSVHSEMRWAEHFQPDDSAGQWRNNGFTAVQSSIQDGVFRGQAVTVSLADKENHPLIYRSDGAHQISFDRGSGYQEYPASIMGSMALIRQTLSDARWYQAQSEKGLITELEPQQSLAPLANLPEQQVVFTSYHPDDTLRALRLLGEFEVKPALLGTGLEFERLADLSRWNATLILPLKQAAKPSLDSSGDALDISLRQLRHWERTPGNPAAVAEAGLPFALTQYGIEADQFWPRLKTAIEHGLSADDALAALTTVPARITGIADQAGKIAPGYRADLVVAKGDLFADGQLQALYLQGQYHPLEVDHTPPYLGQFALTLDDNELSLLVENQDELSASLSSGEASLELFDVNVNPYQLNGKVRLDALGYPGISVLSLSPSSGGLNGTLLLPDGQRQALALTSQSKAESTAQADPESDRPEYVSRVTLPNRAYGLDALPQAENLHIQNATVWTSDERGILTDTDVLVRDGRIREVGKNLETPRGYRVIDGTGKHLTAGIIDEHSHIALYGGTNEGSDAITSEVRIGDILDPSDIHIYRALAGGVTTAQLLHGSANPIGGQAQTIQLRWGENAEGLKFDAAPPSIKFALGENVKQSNWGDDYVTRYPQSRMGVEALYRDAFQAAREYRAAQQRYDDLSRSAQRRTLAPRPDYRLDALAEILEENRHIHVHSYVQSEIIALLDLAKEMDFKVQTFTHILEGYKVAREMAAAGTTASTFSDWWAYKFEVYDAIPQNACIMTEQGVNTSINSDSRDLIRKLNQEAAKSVMYCDMSPEEAWKMITINPAQQLKIDHLVGSIAEGKQADLVLWSGNPLSVYARAETTWIAGKPYFDRQRDLAERRRLSDERQALLQKLLADDAPAGSGDLDVTPEETPEWHCDSVSHFVNGRLVMHHH